MDSLYSETDEESYNESDEELQEAFAKGLLKPGLNIPQEIKPKKVYVNDTEYLNKTLNEIKLNLPWIEKLDITSGLAPMGPEMAFKIKETENQRQRENKNKKKGAPALVSLDDDPVLNDFKRETLFERQAQQAILTGMEKLTSLKINRKRPDDYFVEMVKSDEHMQKVRKNLQHKQLAVERSEKAKKYRSLKKLGKQLQNEAKVRKINEKKEMLNEVKKFRKGKRQDLDFLENKPKKPMANKNSMNKSKQAKLDFKNKKFGFGGKKRGTKSNTKNSTNDVFNDSNRKSKKGGPQKRLGKTRRHQNKANKNK